MSCASRSGLVPTPKKGNIVLSQKPNKAVLPQNFEAIPMALSLRPFGGLLNPFAKGCSVLCNHPAPVEVKKIINQCKQSLSVEGKHIHHVQTETTDKPTAVNELPDNIPEDLFRRYTDTDSRPLTPTPTLTSIHTRTSTGSFLNNRRCITPEQGTNGMTRKKIILDLRKSHSQETLYWKPCSDLSSGGDFGDSEQKARSASAVEVKKMRKQKLEEQKRPTSIVTATIPEEIGEKTEEAKRVISTCINEEDFANDDDIRRGKRRKKIKSAVTTTTTFHLSRDPETQVATLGCDSLNASTRPSLVPNSISLLPRQEIRTSKEVLLKDSFLTDEVFQVLRTKLDVDLIENTFDTYLHRAYQEAYKYLPLKPKDSNDVIKELEKLNIICEKMPRKFSKSATRFDVPMDVKSMKDMSVVQYLSKYVWISRQRKQIFKRIFLKHLEFYPEHEQQQYTNVLNLCLTDNHERYLDIKQLHQALEDVLEFYGTEHVINSVLELINYNDLVENDYKINFRLWCGIVAFAERLALDDPTCTDSCEELEKADFNSMEIRLQNFKLPANLEQVFCVIRNTHNIKS